MQTFRISSALELQLTSVSEKYPLRKKTTLLLNVALFSLIFLGGSLFPFHRAFAAASYAVTDYRWRNDDGSQTTATWKAAKNTAVTGVAKNETIRLRVVWYYNFSSAGSVTANITYSTSTAGPWTTVPVTATTEAFEMTTSSYFANGDATTQQVSTGSFNAGKCVESPSNTSTAITISPEYSTEVEFAIRATNNAVAGQTYYFNFTPETSGAPDNYPTVTIVSTVPKYGTGSYRLDSNIALSGDLDVYGSTIDANTTGNYQISIGGMWRNRSGFPGFRARQGTVKLTGANQTLSGSTAFYNLTKTGSTAATLTLSRDGIRTVSGALVLKGVVGQLLSIRSATAGVATALRLSVTGTQDVAYLDVQDSNATGGQALTCLVAGEGCTDSGDNTNWIFHPYSISGKVFSDEGTTKIAGVTVAASLNGGATVQTDDTDGGGEYTLTGLHLTGGTIITLYLDGETQDAITVTLGSGSSMTGMHLYQDHLIVRSDSGSVALTNAHLAIADNSGDSDLASIYRVSNGTLQIEANKELYVWTGDTFAPGGRVFTHDLEVKGTLSMGTSGLTASGSFVANAGTFTTSTGILLNARGTSETLNLGTNSTQDLTISSPIADYSSLNTGLLSRWKFDETAGNTAVDSVSGYNGTWAGSTTASTDLPTVSFTDLRSISLASSSYVTVTDSAQKFGGTGPITITGWIKTTDASCNTWSFLARSWSDNGWYFYSCSGNSIVFIPDAPDSGAHAFTASQALNYGQWNHFGMVYNGSTITMYVNGVGNSSAWSSGLKLDGTTMTFGRKNQWGGYATAKLDDVRIYNRSLTSQEMGYLATGFDASIPSQARGQITLNSSLDINGNFVLMGGAFNANTHTITVSGNWNNPSTGTGFVKGTSTVSFDGTGNQTISGSTLFHNFSVATTSARTIFFSYLGTQSVSGSLVLHGTDGNLLSLKSTKTGSAATLFLDADSTQLASDIAYLNVKDSNATGGQALLCYTATEGCVNGGNDTNWTFLSSSTTTLTSSDTSTVYGEGVTLTATIDPLTATGTVTFKDGATTIDSTTLGHGSGSIVVSSLGVGSHSLTAVYAGNATYSGSTSTAVTQEISKASTITTLASSDTSTAYGESVTLTATLNPLTATGTVTFKDGATTIDSTTLGHGSGSIVVSSLGVGNHSLTAVYAGNGTYNGSTSDAVGQAIVKITTTTTIGSSDTSTTYGDGVTLTATINPLTATGTVTFKDGATTIDSATLGHGSGSIVVSSLSVGSHSLTAVYAGNATHSGSTSTAVTQEISKAATTTTITSSLNPSVEGNAVTFTATVTPDTATGTITFKDGISTIGEATMGHGSGAITVSNLITGEHSITAEYAGNASYLGSTANAVVQEVQTPIQESSTVLASSLNPSVFGNSVTLTATVTPGAATGTLTFKEGTTTIGETTLGHGSGVLVTADLSVGTHSLVAVYAGNGQYNGSQSDALAQVVQYISTTTGIASSLNPSTYGASVTFTATVSPITATGTVTFKDGATTIGSATLGNGSGTLAVSSLTVGSHSLTAVYAGNATHSGSTSGMLSQEVNKITTTATLTSSDTSTTYGDSVILTATLNPLTATGTVTFKDGATTIDSTTLGHGSGSIVVSSLSVGSHSLTAVYAGNGTHSEDTSEIVVQTVEKIATATTLVSSLNPSTYGSGVTLTATVTPSAATGTLTLMSGATALGTTTLGNGSGSFTLSTINTGSNSITAVYGGNVTHSGSTSNTVTQVVATKRTTVLLAANPNPSAYYQTVTFTASVFPPQATGTVTFKRGTTTLSTRTLSSGVATFTYAALDIGSHSITAIYNGTSNYIASTSNVLTQTVNESSTVSMSLRSSRNPSTYGTPTRFTALISNPNPIGTVTFYEGDTLLGSSSVARGSGSILVSSFNGGIHNITALYSDDENYPGGGRATLSQRVNTMRTTLALATSNTPIIYGNSITLTATITPDAATGAITFKDGTATIGTGTLVNGTSTITVTNLTVGTHGLTASYAGSQNYSNSNSPRIYQVVQKTTTPITLTSSHNPSAYDEGITLTARTNSGATGTYRFLDGTTTIGTATSQFENGYSVGRISNVKLHGGTHSITVVYNGNTYYASGTSDALTQTVSKAATTLSLVSNRNPALPTSSITLLAAVSPSTATGTVTFYDGATTLGTKTLSSGIASISVSGLALGTHSLTAEYGGNTNYNASSSDTYSQVIASTVTTVGISASPNPINYGTPTLLKATVSPSSATGTFTFSHDATVIGTATISRGSGTLLASALPIGRYMITAAYSGNARYAAAERSTTMTVNRVTPTVTLTSSTNPATYGNNITLHATVNPASATGTITFRVGSTQIETVTLSHGSGSITTTFNVGTFNLYAQYSGNASYNAATSPALPQVVAKASPVISLVSSANPSHYGNSVTFTASTDLNATGNFVFKDGATTIATVRNSYLTGQAQASYTTATLSPGSHAITATFVGNSNYLSGVSDALAQVVSKRSTTTTIIPSQNPSTYGEDIILYALVHPSTATGTVTFYDGTTALGSANISNGSASVQLDSMEGGTHTLTAAYGGNYLYEGSTSSSVTETIDPEVATVALNINPTAALFASLITFTSTTNPLETTGNFTFASDTVTFGSALDEGGSGTYVTDTLWAGVHAISTTYSGDANHTSATAGGILTLQQHSTTITLTVDPASGTYGSGVTLTATIEPATATGSVQFLDGNVILLRTLSASGTATVTIADFAPGSHTITALYEGNINYAGSTSAESSLTITKASSTLALSLSAATATYGEEVTLTALVQPADATGSITFFNGLEELGTVTLQYGSAILAVDSLNFGNHDISATYSGNTNYLAASSDAESLTVGQVATSISVFSEPNPSVYGSGITVYATMTPTTVTGSVTILSGATTIGTISLSNGSGTTLIEDLPVGAYTLEATFAGTMTYAASSATFTHSVLKTQAAVVLASSSNPAPYGATIVLTATAAPADATGTFSFYSGSTLLDIVTVGHGSGSLTIAGLVPGTYAFSTTYGGNTNYEGATSNVLTQTMNPPPTGTVRATVWNDEDGDGIKDAGETESMENVSLTLSGFSATGVTILRTAQTDADGAASFAHILISDTNGYTMTLSGTTLPVGYLNTTYTLSGSNMLGTGATITFLFGFVEASDLTGTVFLDTDADGLKDAGETQGLPGVALTLVGTSGTGGSVRIVTTTNTNGAYAFEGLPTSSGGFLLVATPPDGYEATTTSSRTVSITTGGRTMTEQIGMRLISASGDGDDDGDGDEGVTSIVAGGSRSPGEPTAVIHVPVQISPSPIAVTPTPSAPASAQPSQPAITAAIPAIPAPEQPMWIATEPTTQKPVTTEQQPRAWEFVLFNTNPPQTLQSILDTIRNPVSQLADNWKTTGQLTQQKSEKITSTATQIAVENMHAFSQQTTAIIAGMEDRLAQTGTQAKDALATGLAAVGDTVGMLANRTSDAFTTVAEYTQGVTGLISAISPRPAFDFIAQTAEELKTVTSTVTNAAQELQTAAADAMANRITEVSNATEETIQGTFALVGETVTAWNALAESTLTSAMTAAQEQAEQNTQAITNLVRASGRSMATFAQRGNERGMQALSTAQQVAGRGRATAQTVARAVQEGIGGAAPEDILQTLPPARRYQTSIRKVDDKLIIAALSVTVLDSLGMPIGRTPVVLFSTPKVAITNDDGIATFHDVEAGEHTLEVHRDGIVEKKALVIEPPSAGIEEIHAAAGTPVILPEARVVMQDTSWTRRNIVWIFWAVIATVLVQVVGFSFLSWKYLRLKQAIPVKV